MYSTKSSTGVVTNNPNCQLQIPFDLCTATSIGDTDLVHQMLMLPHIRALLNVPNKSGWTPTMYSAYYGHDKMLDLLIQNGAKVNLINATQQTALILSVKCGNLECCEILLKNGASIDVTDADSLTALAYAASAGYDDVTHFLIKHNANINMRLGVQKMTPLMFASSAGHEKVIRTLIEAGANPYLKSLNEKTAMELAYEKGHRKVLSLFSEYQTPVFSSVPYEKPPMKKYSDLSIPQAIGLSHTPVQMGQQYPQNLASLLSSLGLSDYIALFDRHNITLKEFLHQTKDSLKELGVDKLGPRNKMLKAITNFASEFVESSSPLNKIAANKQQLEIESLKEKLALCEALLFQERMRALDLHDPSKAGNIKLVQECMLPMFNLGWQSESLKRTVKLLRENLWEEQNKIDRNLLLELYDKVHDIEKLSADMHGQISVFLEILRQM